MPRGTDWAIYVGDDGNVYSLRVDADYVLEFARGWTTTGVAGVPPLPRGWRARRVKGIDELGNIRFALVARLDAELWTGATTQFQLETSSTGPDAVAFYDVIELQGERSRARP